MPTDDSPLTRLWQMIKTAFTEDQSVPLEDLRRIAYELEAELKPAQEDLVVLTPYLKNGQTEFAEIGTSFWHQQSLHVTLHAVPLNGTLILRLAAPAATPKRRKAGAKSR